MTTATAPETAQPPILLGLPELTKLLDGQVASQTIRRWRVPRGQSGPVLPEPYLVVARTPLWREDTLVRFCEERGYQPNARALAKIRKDQRARQAATDAAADTPSN